MYGLIKYDKYDDSNTEYEYGNKSNKKEMATTLNMI